MLSLLFLGHAVGLKASALGMKSAQATGPQIQNSLKSVRPLKRFQNLLYAFWSKAKAYIIQILHIYLVPSQSVKVSACFWLLIIGGRKHKVYSNVLNIYFDSSFFIQQLPE